ncbi:MAG TPA: hypothetical protein VK745_26295 [Polyangiaceae bacterium]|nr:hypothetical protein [Polyangiaceae bacterium]
MASRARSRAERGRRFGALLACSLFLSVASARAQEDAETRTMARDLATQGGQAFDAGNYAAASDFFRRAHQLVAAPSIALMQARCLVKLGQLLAAIDIYEQTARLKLADDAPEAYVTAVQTAYTEVEEVRKRLPRLKLTVLGTANGDGAQVTIDDKPTPAALLGVERPVDPGVHHFAVRIGGQTRAAAELTVVEGQSYQVELDAHPARPAAEPSPASLETQSASSNFDSRTTLGYVGLGLGVVGLGVGTYTGLVALHHQSSLDSACHPICPASSASDIDSWRSNRTVSWLSYGVGVAAAGAGVLLLTLGKPNRDQVALRALPNGLQIGGQL